MRPSSSSAKSKYQIVKCRSRKTRLVPWLAVNLKLKKRIIVFIKQKKIKNIVDFDWTRHIPPQIVLLLPSCIFQANNKYKYPMNNEKVDVRK